MIHMISSKSRGMFLVLVVLFVMLNFHSEAWALDDPGVPGPLPVSAKEYYGADITLPNFPGPVEQRAIVWHPTDMTGNVFPLIIFLHGRHVTCYQGTNIGLAYPCPTGSQPIPNYRGYDYLAASLASNGYIVLSISANGINARDNMVDDAGALARAQLIQRHLDLWRAFNNGSDPFGGIFRGRVNLNNVGTMGHSRGGEGVVRHFLYNASLGSPYGIKAVLPLAPVNFSRNVINKVALGVLLPYCDGDVSDLQGVHYYDDTRYNVADDPAAKHMFLVWGANHNFYNSVWTPGLFSAGTADDWFDGSAGATTDMHCGSFGTGKRLTAAQQQATALAYVKAFFRVYIGNRTELLPYLTSEAPPPPSVQGAQIHASYHAPANLRRDINRLLTSSNLTTNTMGGSVGQSGITPYSLCGGATPQPLHCLPNQPVQRQPHTAPAAIAKTKRGLSQLQLGWTSSSAYFANQVPATYANVSSFTSLVLRAAVDFSNNRNPSSSVQDFSIVLIDSAGRQAAARVSGYSRALFLPPGSNTNYRVPKVVLNTVRVPLAAFTGIDKTKIQAVGFVMNQRSTGALLINDLAFAK